MTAARDPYLALPLDGVQSIEASAGTGKTFTLATLVVRLVVEGDLRIGEILAVTFTEAATQELRARIRARLLLAASLPAVAAADEGPEVALTRALLDAHRARSGESPTALHRRLREAADGMDLAAVFTIHGFCARVLREHALESGHGFDAPQLLANDASLRQEIAADLWRAHGVDDDGADDLLALWKGGPEALAADLPVLLREQRLQPHPDDPLPADPAPALREAGEALAVAYRAHGNAFRDALVAAVEGKVLHGGSYKVEWIAALFDALGAWALADDAGVPFAHDKLPQLRREALLQRTSKGGTGRTPASPLSDAIDVYLQMQGRIEAYREARRVALLHRLRDDARARLVLRKQQLRVQTYDDLIDGVADALETPHADALVQRLRAQYRVALVDEFQDTDPRQWRIFDRVFGSRSPQPALFVIGDPKQAIYGFRGGDVETYLAAQADAVAAPPLSHNFRSRPSVLRAIEALYAQAGDAAFVDERIRFHPVAPGGTRHDDDFQRHGTAAPALTVWQAPSPAPGPDGKLKPWDAGTSRELATAACVAAIHGVLVEARSGAATIAGRPVRPGDIAVLVRTHRDATRIRQALAEVGIPAVAAGKLSLFATPEARELHALLRTLMHGADDGHLRTALSTVLLGVDATGIAALEIDGDAMRRWQQRAQDWRERLQRGGPLALVNDLCAEHAPRLLGLLDGERRLTNYLQTAEMLQEADARTLGLPGLVDWLAAAIADAGTGADDDAQLLRLESDAHRVQVVTLHKSKGLEYPLVFLPYAGIGGKAPDPGQRVVVTDADGRVLHWKLQDEVSGWSAAKAQWSEAQRAEDARLLYVGLTRACHALWLAAGAFYQHAQSPLWAMVRDADALLARDPGIRIDTTSPPAALPWLPPVAGGAVPAARIARRSIAPDWWVYSFTQLAHADAGHAIDAASTEADGAAADEPVQLPDDADASADIPADAYDPRFSGSRFGNVLHAALEDTRFSAWAPWQVGDAAPEGEHAALLAALRREGYAQDDLADGIALLTSLVGRTLTVVLPEGGALHALGEYERRAEIEFHFALASTAVPALLALLHAHGVVRARQGFGLRSRLEGLMTGKIDLTYVRDGRWYVLDYKSNRLPRYDAPALAAAMAHSEYDLQALVYTVALHRWLRFRLGDGYDYARDFGGIRYVFCRGLEPARDASLGVHAQRFAPELVHALDALFAGHGQEAAA
jgi:exodeoxyribonuclease V beta subunit